MSAYTAHILTVATVASLAGYGAGWHIKQGGSGAQSWVVFNAFWLAEWRFQGSVFRVFKARS